MKHLFNWQIVLGVVLIVLTAIVYYIHYVIFRDPHHIMIYFFGDFAFVFFELLLVMLVIHRLLHHREIKARENKLNMLIGAFFSETGTELLSMLACSDHDLEKDVMKLELPEDLSEREFLNIRKGVENQRYYVQVSNSFFAELKAYLLEKKQFVLDLLINENTVEHESFTNLLWSVYHLTEELEHNEELPDLSKDKLEHLVEDANRVYHLLTIEWIDYIKHLKKKYPYLFSLAARKNPFRCSASVEVR